MRNANGTGRAGAGTHPSMAAGRRPLLPPRAPRYRWSSSLAARARSLHLISCREPLSCSQSEPSPSADGWLAALEEAWARRTRSSVSRSTAREGR